MASFSLLKGFEKITQDDSGQFKVTQGSFFDLKSGNPVCKIVNFNLLAGLLVYIVILVMRNKLTFYLILKKFYAYQFDFNFKKKIIIIIIFSINKFQVLKVLLVEYICL